MNLPKENITLEELKLCPEFAGLTEEMAQKMLNYLKEFCAILSAACLEGIKASEQKADQ